MCKVVSNSTSGQLSSVSSFWCILSYPFCVCISKKESTVCTFDELFYGQFVDMSQMDKESVYFLFSFSFIHRTEGSSVSISPYLEFFYEQFVLIY